MKENIKWAIVGISIIIVTLIYVFGTRYNAISVSGGGGFSGHTVIYDRITGNSK